MKKHITKFIVLLYLIQFLFPVSVLANPAELPQVMVGTPRVEYDLTKKLYGDFTGTEVVYNDSESGQLAQKNYAPSIGINGGDSPIGIDDKSSVYIANTTNFGTVNFTVSIWFKRNATVTSGHYQYLFRQGTYDTVIRFINSNLELIGWGWTGSPTYDTQSASLPALGDSWHNITVTRNVTADTVSAYLDGSALTLSGSAAAEDAEIPAGDFNLGKGCGDIGCTIFHYFEGKIDDVRLYNSALDQSAAQNIFYGNPTSTNLVSHWDFHEGSGNASANQVSGGSNAILRNTPTWENSDGPGPTDFSNPGYEPFGFDQENLAKCIGGIILGTSPWNCLISNNPISPIKMMNSRTEINGQISLELATLVYPTKSIIVGDAYLKDLDPNNFSYWGKNMTTHSSGLLNTNPESYWGFKGYTNIADSTIAGYAAKIKELLKEAPEPNIPQPQTYLQTTNMLAPTGPYPTGNDDSNLYPEGKIWSQVDKSEPGYMGANRTYYGIGTIIYNFTSGTGPVCLGQCNTSTPGLNLKKHSNTDQLGIIVLGDLKISGSSNIDAAIFCTGTMSIGNNVTLKGSFAAKEFQIGNGVKFLYDWNLDKNMPPGFRELNMPSPTQN